MHKGTERKKKCSFASPFPKGQKGGANVVFDGGWGRGRFGNEVPHLNQFSLFSASPGWQAGLTTTRKIALSLNFRHALRRLIPGIVAGLAAHPRR